MVDSPQSDRTTRSRSKSISGFFSRARSRSHGRLSKASPRFDHLSDADSLPPSPTVHHNKSSIPTITTTISRESSSSSTRGPPGRTSTMTGIDSPLSHSLALLDSKLASIESLSSKNATSTSFSSKLKSKSIPDMRSHFNSNNNTGTSTTRPLQPKNLEVGGGMGTASSRLSLSAYQLPSPNRVSGLFGTNNAMLWDALGLDATLEEDSEELSLDNIPSFSRSLSSSQPLQVDSSRRAAPAFGEEGDEEEEEIDSPGSSPRSSVSTVEEHSEDIFNLSEFPAYPDFPSFDSSTAAKDTAATASKKRTEGNVTPVRSEEDGDDLLVDHQEYLEKRSSNLLVFPVPPASPPSMLLSTTSVAPLSSTTTTTTTTDDPLPRPSEDSLNSSSYSHSLSHEDRPSLTHLHSTSSHVDQWKGIGHRSSTWGNGNGTYSRPISSMTDFSAGEHAATQHEEKAFERLARMVLASNSDGGATGEVASSEGHSSASASDESGENGHGSVLVHQKVVVPSSKGPTMATTKVTAPIGLGISTSESNLSLGSLAASLGLSSPSDESGNTPFNFSTSGPFGTGLVLAPVVGSNDGAESEEEEEGEGEDEEADRTVSTAHASDVSPPETPNFSLIDRDDHADSDDEDDGADTSASSLGSFSHVLNASEILEPLDSNTVAPSPATKEVEPTAIPVTPTETNPTSISAIDFLSEDPSWIPPRPVPNNLGAESPSARILRSQGTLPPIFRSNAATPWSPPPTVTPISSAADTKPLGSPLTLQAPSFSRGTTGSSEGTSKSSTSQYSEHTELFEGKREVEDGKELVASPTSYLPHSPSLATSSSLATFTSPLTSPTSPTFSTNTTPSPMKKFTRRLSFSSLRRKKSDVGISSNDISKFDKEKDGGYESDGASIKSSSSRKSRLSLYIPKRFGKKDEPLPPMPSLPGAFSSSTSLVSPGLAPAPAPRSAPPTQSRFELANPPLSASSYTTSKGSPLLSAGSSSTSAVASPTTSSFAPLTPLTGRNSPTGDGYFTFPQSSSQAHSIARKPSPSLPAFEPPPTPKEIARLSKASSPSQSPLPSPAISASFLSAQSLRPQPEKLKSADSTTTLSSMKTASSSLASLSGVADSPEVVQDVIKFPVADLGPLPTPPARSPALTPSTSKDALGKKSLAPVTPVSDEDEDEEEDESDDEGDDRPLGTIPGALTSQKRLLSESRTQRRLAKLKAANTSAASDPFEFDKSWSSPAATPSPSLSASPGGDSRTSSPSAGHSLLPHTDDAVKRRSANDISRSPSMPLSPAIAESTLTFDKPSSPPPTEPQSASVPLSTPTPVVAAAKTIDSPPDLASVRPERPVLSVNTGPPQQRAVVVQHTSQPSQAASSHRLSLAPPPQHQLPAPPASRPLPPPSIRQMSSSSLLAPPSPARHPSPSISAASTSQHRIFIDDHTKHMMVTVSDITRCGDIVLGAKDKGVLTSGSNSDGGFALWEICRNYGVERPIREYEFLVDVVKSWDTDTNILIIRRTFLWPVLSKHLRPQPILPKDDFVMIEAKKGKWVRRHLVLEDGNMWHSKGERTKDTTMLCTLSAYDIFFVAPHMIAQLQAPKPYVFALKSLLPKVHFEEEADYCFFVSVNTQQELTSWVKTVTEARNVFARQREQMVLTAKGLAPSPSKPQPVSSNSYSSSSSFSSRGPSPLSQSYDDTPTRSTKLHSNSKSLTASAPPMMKARSAPGGSVVSGGGGIASRPEPGLWASMNETERQKWLKDAEKEARVKGQTLLDLGGETEGPKSPKLKMMGRLRSKSLSSRK